MKKSAVKNHEEKKPQKKRSALKEEVYASEVRYQRLFESTKVGILILDAETGKIVDVNPFLIDLLGYSKEEFIEKSIWEIGAFHNIIENKDKLLELQQNEYVRYEDLPLETSDGSKIYVEFVSNIYLVNNHKVIQCQIRDITARKKTEAALEKTRKELAEIKKSADELNEFTENVIDTVREPLLAIDQDLRVIKASRSFYQFFKVTPDETIGKLIYELGNHQWDIPKLKELLEKIIPEKNSFDNFEVEHRFSTIGKRVMLLNARQVKRAFGKEKIILLAIEDITERKGKEDSLQETQRETSGSLNILLDMMQAPIIIWNTSMIVKRFNRQFELLSGYDSDEVIDKKIDFLFPKEKIAATLELLKNHLADEHEVVELDILTKDNQIKTVLWNSSRILDEDGKNIIATISQDITNRRQSELALRKSESHLRTLVNTIPDLIWLKDTNGVFLSCNPMFERFVGASEPDIIGKTDYDFVERELADFFRENDRKAIEAGKPTSNEEWVTFADDGHRAFLDTIKSPIYDSDGTVLGILGIGRDITERMLAGEKLQASEKRFRAIFDQAPVAIALLDMQGHPIVSNLSLSKMLGYTTDELSKMMFTEFTYPEDINKDLNQFTDLITGKISRYSMEKRYIHKNRNIIWANLFVTTLNDNNGLPQEIIGMVEDITEQKKIHNEIKFQADLLNNVGQAVIASDLHDRVIYWNNVAQRIYGWSSDEAMGQNIISLIPTNPTKKQARELFKNLSQGMAWSGEFQMKRKDGSSFPAYVTDTPILDTSGELIGVMGISSDKTERKRAEQDLIIANKELVLQNDEKEKRAAELIIANKELVFQNKEKGKRAAEFVIANKELVFQNDEKEKRAAELIIANKELVFQNDEKEKRAAELIIAKEKAEESDRLKSAFLANMSHEVRTPLNSIIGFSELLTDPDFDEDQKNDFIQHIIASGNNLLTIISDIMDISKMESGEITIRKKPINAHEYVLGIYEQFSFQAETHKLELILNLPDNDKETEIFADTERLRQIFNNLIGNAFKFTVNGSIEIGYRLKGEMVEFFVKDTGIGIPASYHDKIFDRFRQVEDEKNRKYGGNGLGLAITKNLVGLMGGKIWVVSESGVGSVFYFTLPIFNCELL